MLDWAWNEISNLMLTAEIEMILADFCQTALCRSYLNSGRFICVGMTTDFILCNSSHHMLLMQPSILSNVSHCIVSVIKFQSQFRLLARLQVAFVTLPLGEGLTPPQVLSHSPGDWAYVQKLDSMTYRLPSHFRGSICVKFHLQSPQIPKQVPSSHAVKIHSHTIRVIVAASLTVLYSSIWRKSLK